MGGERAVVLCGFVTLFITGIVIIVLLVTSLGQRPDGHFGLCKLSETRFTYRQQLDDNYTLSWNVNSTHILFQVQVKTTGYIGFGISGNGNMFPSDVIVTWVEEGQVHFSDRHISSRDQPVLAVLDISVDWHLISGLKIDEYTIVTFIRQLNTCDDDDFPITEGITRLIFCYSPTNPDTELKIHYHGSTRGTKSVMLIDPPKIADIPDDVIAIDVLKYNYPVPSTETTNNCRLYKLPPLTEKHHVVRVEPVIQKGNEHLIHHIKLYQCDDALNDNMVGYDYECREQAVGGMQVKGCDTAFLVLHMGGTPFNYPSHVGHSLGSLVDPTFFRLEMHYYNAETKSGFVDSSGIRMYLTKQLRENDAGVLVVGVIANDLQIIPPHAANFLSRGYCHENCIVDALGDDEIHVFAGSHEANHIGKSIRTRIFRKGIEFPPILEDKVYNYDFHETMLLTEERVVKKGDTLFTDCIYDSLNKQDVTYGGYKAGNEKCLSFIMYYPRKPLVKCQSMFDYGHHYPSFLDGGKKNIQVAIRESLDKKININGTDWTNGTNRELLTKVMEDSGTWHLCIGPDGSQSFHRDQPTLSRPYQPPAPCKKN